MTVVTMHTSRVGLQGCEDESWAIKETHFWGVRTQLWGGRIGCVWEHLTLPRKPPATREFCGWNFEGDHTSEGSIVR